MELRALTIQDCLSVVSRMRDLDRAGVHALMGPVDDESFALNRYQVEGPCWAMMDSQGVPQMIGGLQFVNGWTGVLWLVATKDLCVSAWCKLVRLVRTVLANALRPNKDGLCLRQRIEAHVLSTWPEAQALVARLGMKHEGTRMKAGYAGEDLQIWAVTV